MSKQYDAAIVIGRFQIFHNGHKKLLDRAHELSDRVFIFVGSSFAAPNPKNPFSFDERRELIEAAMGYDDNSNVEIIGVPDYHYSNAEWASYVRGSFADTHEGELKNVALVGFEKDDSSFYLRMFPEWDLCTIQPLIIRGWSDDIVEESFVLSSTMLRENFYKNSSWHIGSVIDDWINKQFIPEGDYVSTLINILSTDKMDTICQEAEHYEAYRKPYEALPFPPIFVTVDACVVCNGHILLIRRRTHPGKGLMALPGGFLDQTEFIEDAIVRELAEETRIKVSKEKLKDNIKFVRVFDSPKRSLRGRSITHCGLIVLNLPELPKVRGSDDADRASWVPLHKFFGMSEQMFEDHYSIISAMVGGM